MSHLEQLFKFSLCACLPPIRPSILFTRSVLHGTGALLSSTLFPVWIEPFVSTDRLTSMTRSVQIVHYRICLGLGLEIHPLGMDLHLFPFCPHFVNPAVRFCSTVNWFISWSLEICYQKCKSWENFGALRLKHWFSAEWVYITVSHVSSGVWILDLW